MRSVGDDVEGWELDCSGVRQRLAVRVGCKDIRTSLEPQRSQQVHLRSRFLARLGVTRCRKRTMEASFGTWRPANKCKHSVTGVDASSEISAAGRSHRNSHSSIHSSLGQQHWSLARGYQRRSNHIFHNGLLWFKNHLFVVSNKKIKEFDASTGSEVSKWPTAGCGTSVCMDATV